MSGNSNPPQQQSTSHEGASTIETYLTPGGGALAASPLPNAPNDLPQQHNEQSKISPHNELSSSVVDTLTLQRDGTLPSSTTNTHRSSMGRSLPPLHIATRMANLSLPPLHTAPHRKRKRFSAATYSHSPTSTVGTPQGTLDEHGTPLSSTTPVMSPGGTFLAPGATLIPLKKRRKLLTDSAPHHIVQLAEKHTHLDHDERLRRVNSTPSTPSTPAASANPDTPISFAPTTTSFAHEHSNSENDTSYTTTSSHTTKHKSTSKKSKPSRKTSPQSPSSLASNHALTDAQLQALQVDVQRLINSLKSTLGEGIKRGTVKKRETLAQQKIRYALELPLTDEHVSILLLELNTRLKTSITLTTPTSDSTFKIKDFYTTVKDAHPGLPWRKLFSSDLPPTINEDFAIPYRLAALLYTHLFPEQTSVIYADDSDATPSFFSDTTPGVVDDQKLAEKAVCCHCLLQLIPGKGRRGSGNLPRHKKKTCRAIGLKPPRGGAAAEGKKKTTTTTAAAPPPKSKPKKSTTSAAVASSVTTPTSLLGMGVVAGDGVALMGQQREHSSTRTTSPPESDTRSFSTPTSLMIPSLSANTSTLAHFAHPGSAMTPLSVGTVGTPTALSPLGNGFNPFMNYLQFPTSLSRERGSPTGTSTTPQQ